jgi:hypothetical protein
MVRGKIIHLDAFWNRTRIVRYNSKENRRKIIKKNTHTHTRKYNIKSTFLLGGGGLSGTEVTTDLLHQPGWRRVCSNRWNSWQGEPKYLEKPAPVSLCPPQIPHGLTRARTQVEKVGSRWLTISALTHFTKLLWSTTSPPFRNDRTTDRIADSDRVIHVFKLILPFLSCGGLTQSLQTDESVKVLVKE